MPPKGAILVVSLEDTARVDAPATEALRSELRATRGDLKLFDYGPGIADLRANCLAETGLPAPVQPVWPMLEAAE